MTDIPHTFGDGRYRILEQVGAGGMGTVYRAVQEPLGRPVALKVLRGEFSHNAVVRRRFTREARAVAGLNHPNIATVFDFGAEADGTLYLAMEFIEGAPLTTQMVAGMTPRHLLGVIDAILSALAHAHARGVIHRDLKPDNILLGFKPGTLLLPSREDIEQVPQLVKLVDFGIARVRRSSMDDPGDTGSGQVVGTPLYMSPEQARGERHISHSADLYSVGVVLFEGLTGHHPFAGQSPDETSFDIMVRHVTHATPQVQPPPGVYVPRALRAVVRRCLQKRSTDRYASAAELREALQEAATLLEANARFTLHGPDGAEAVAEGATAVPDQRVSARARRRTIQEISGGVEMPRGTGSAPTHDAIAMAQTDPQASVPTSQAVTRQRKPRARPQRVVFEVPLVGREQDRGLLTKAVTRCLDESIGQVVWITGEAGVGKTALATWLQEHVSETGQLLPLIGAFMRDSDGLRGLRDALEALFLTRGQNREAARITLSERLAAYGVSDEADTEAVLKFLRPSDTTRPIEGSQEVLFASLVRVLERVCRVHPLFVMLDDIHWAGPELSALLEYLAVEFRYRPCPLMILCTVRTEELVNNPRLASGLRRLSRYEGETATRIALDRLSEGDRLDLIQQILPAETAVATAVANRSQGNPLHIQQLLQYLYQEELLRFDEVDGVYRFGDDEDAIARVPPSLADLLVLRLEQVKSRFDAGGAYLDILERCAVLGARFAFEVLEDMVAREGKKKLVDAVEDAVDDLLAESLLVQVKGRSDDLLAFNHGLVREVLLENLKSPLRLRRLHRSAAEAKAHFYRDRLKSAAEDIAHHYRAAGDFGDALQFVLLAASAARASYRLRDATRLYWEAAALVEESGVGQSLALTIKRRLGGLYEGFGQFHHASHIFAGLLRVALFEGSAEALDRAAFDGALKPLPAPEIHVLLEALETSTRFAALEQTGREEVVRAALGLGRITRQLGQPKLALQFLDHCLRLAESCAFPGWIDAVQIQRGWCAWDAGDYPRANTLGADALDSAVQGADAFNRANALHLLAEVARMMGDPATTAERMIQAREAYEILGDRHRVAQCQRDLAQLARARSDIEHAGHLFAEARQRFEALGDRHAAASCLNGLGEVARFKGQAEVAAGCYQRAYETLKSLGARVPAAICLTNLALNAMGQDDLTRAETHFEAVQAELKDLQHPYLAVGLHLNIAWLRARQDRWDDVDAHLDVAFPQLDKHAIADPDYARPLETIAALMRQRDLHDDAKILTTRANRMWTTLGRPKPPKT